MRTKAELVGVEQTRQLVAKLTSVVPLLAPAHAMLSAIIALGSNRRVLDDNSITAEELESVHGRRVQCRHYIVVSSRLCWQCSKTDTPELSSAVASSTIRRFGL